MAHFLKNRCMDQFQKLCHLRAIGKRSGIFCSRLCKRASSLLTWKVQGSAKLSHLIFQNWRRVVRKTLEYWHKSVSRRPKARRRSHTKSADLLLYRHCERIFGDVNIVPLFGESFEGKQIAARPEKPGAETELNCSFEIQLQFIPPPDGAIVISCDSDAIGLDIRIRIEFRRKDDQLRRA